MCNACGDVCCGSGMFGGCGCDGCDDPECWSADNDFDDDDGDEYDFCGCRKPSAFQCVQITEPSHV